MITIIKKNGGIAYESKKDPKTSGMDNVRIAYSFHYPRCRHIRLSKKQLKLKKIKKKASYKKYTYTISASSYYANATYKPAVQTPSQPAQSSLADDFEEETAQTIQITANGITTSNLQSGSAASYEADASSDTACVTVYNIQRGISCKIPLSHVKLKEKASLTII